MSIEEHLSAEQIEWFVCESSKISQPEALNGPLTTARWHVSNCRACSEKVNNYSEAARLFQNLAPIGTPARTADCPDETVWFKTVAGTAQTEEMLANLRHSAQCDHCGQLLKKTISYFADELSQEETQILAKLPSAGIAPQLQLAEKLVSEQNLNRKVSKQVKGLAFLQWPKWPVATAAVLALIMFPLMLWFFLIQSGPSSVDKLLAEAYTQQRTLELRFPGASYGPVRVERRSNRSRMERPGALLEAEARIKRQLQKEPDASRWLQQKARADLLDGDYSAAIGSLSRALESDPGSVSLLSDMATAYFQRAESEDRALDFGESIEFLSQALAKEPDNPVLLFNRAIASERLYLFEQATQDWQHYLRVDPKGDWAQEARERLIKLEQKRKQHDSGALEPLLRPQQIVAAGQRSASEALEARAEEYLEVAIREWLPQAFPSVPGRHPPDESARAALSLLGNILEHNHKDYWLKDLLAQASGPTFGSAVEAMGEAVRLNTVGDPANARIAARKAAKWFGGDRAGALRSGVESVYALRRAEKAEECLLQSPPVTKALLRHRYPWLDAQLRLETSLCWGKAGNLNRSSSGIESALRITEQSHFEILQLRALGLAASVETAKGDSRAIWKRNIEGLAHYWLGSSPPLRGYQFYSNLSFFLDTSESHQLAYLVASEAASVLSASEHDSLKASAYYRLAEAAVAVGKEERAEAAFLESRRLFAALPQNDTTRTYKSHGELALAKFQAHRGAFDEAFAHLQAVHKLLPGLSGYTIPLKYYRTVAEVEQIKGNKYATERALWSVAEIGESALSSLYTDRDRISWNQQMTSVYRDLVKMKLQDGESEKAFEIWEWFRSAALRSRRNTTVTIQSPKESIGIDFKKLERSVPGIEAITADKLTALEHVTLISYAQMSSGLAVWVADDRGIHSAWVPVPESEVRQVTRKFMTECSRPESNISDLKWHGRKLYDWLIVPIKPYLQSDRVLVFEPDAPFSEISIPALVDENGHYFGESFPIAYSLGFGYLENLRHAGYLRKSARAFVVGPPALGWGNGGEWESLPDAAEEAEIVAEKFSSAALITGRKATPKNVQGGFAGAEVFHFAGHAGEKAKEVGLLLAHAGDDSAKPEAVYLGAGEMASVDLKALRLAVLAACSTAKGDERGMADPDSLVHAFVRARVPSVVASRWQVDSKSTSNFMKTFYTDLLAKNTTARAMQSAQLELRSQPGSEHPYYWASFSLFGRE